MAPAVGPQLLPLLLPFFVNLSQTPLPPPPTPEHFYPSHFWSPPFVFPLAEGPQNSNRIFKENVWTQIRFFPCHLAELIEIHLDRVSTSMTVIFFLPGQSQCSLLNYTGVHNAALHKIYCSIGSLLVGVAAMVNVITVITLLWQQRLSNRRQIKICLTQFLKIFFFCPGDGRHRFELFHWLTKTHRESTGHRGLEC